MHIENRFRPACRMSGRKMPQEKEETANGSRNTEVSFPRIELFDTLSRHHTRLNFGCSRFSSRTNTAILALYLAMRDQHCTRGARQTDDGRGSRRRLMRPSKNHTAI